MADALGRDPRPEDHCDTTAAPPLEYLGPTPAAQAHADDDSAAEPLVLVRHPIAARDLATRHAHTVGRLTDRLAACWPDEVDLEELAAEGDAALLHAAVSAEDEDAMPARSVEVVGARLRQVLAASEWYRKAMLGRARPLCEAWRGLVLGGREATDHTLARRLHLGPSDLSERFVELAVIFAIDPGAMLPKAMQAGRPADVKHALAEIISALPVEQQLALALHSHQELTFPEIARVMGIEPRVAQEAFGRAATCVTAEAALSSWPVPQSLTA